MQRIKKKLMEYEGSIKGERLTFWIKWSGRPFCKGGIWIKNQVGKEYLGEECSRQTEQQVQRTSRCRCAWHVWILGMSRVSWKISSRNRGEKFEWEDTDCRSQLVWFYSEWNIQVKWSDLHVNRIIVVPILRSKGEVGRSVRIFDINPSQR